MGNYYIYRIGQFFATILPVPVSSFLVMLLCDMHYRFSKTDRRAVEDNLKIVLKTDHVPKASVRAVFRNFGKYLLEFFSMSRWLRPEFIQSHVHISNISYLNEVLQKGKGAIVVSAHLGNWEMGGAVLPMLGYPLSVVALAHKDPRVNALFNAQRETFGTTVIQTDMAARRVVEQLSQNRLVAILAERDFGNHGLVMNFFGRKAMIPKGAAYFSMKTGAPIIPMFFIRTEEGHFEINIYPPIDPPYVNDGRVSDEAARSYIQQYLPSIEVEIRKNPSQWLLFRGLGIS